MAERGLNTTDPALLQLFTRRTRALLRHQKEARHSALGQRPAARPLRPVGDRRL